MNIEDFREYCLSKNGVTESLPFDENTLVFKVSDKMFAFTVLVGDFYMNLKCDPEKAVELREKYPCVQPGYHMNKKYWNTVFVDSSVNDEILFEWIDHSYKEVVKKLSKKQREVLNQV